MASKECALAGNKEAKNRVEGIYTVATRNAHRYEVSSRQHSMNGQEASENVKKEQLNMAKYDPNQFISAISKKNGRKSASVSLLWGTKIYNNR